MQVILSVDTLDFTKGLIHRVNAFERLLDKYHIHRGAVVLVQICLPSRSEDGQQLRETLENRIHSINSKFSTPDWTPIQLITRPIDDSELAAFYRDSNVALVTPLRDGMNLTGKEFLQSMLQAEESMQGDCLIGGCYL